MGFELPDPTFLGGGGALRLPPIILTHKETYFHGKIQKQNQHFLPYLFNVVTQNTLSFL